MILGLCEPSLVPPFAITSFSFLFVCMLHWQVWTCSKLDMPTRTCSRPPFDVHLLLCYLLLVFFMMLLVHVGLTPFRTRLGSLFFDFHLFLLACMSFDWSTWTLSHIMHVLGTRPGPFISAWPSYFALDHLLACRCNICICCIHENTTRFPP